MLPIPEGQSWPACFAARLPRPFTPPLLMLSRSSAAKIRGAAPGFYTENFQRQFRVPAMSVAVSKGDVLFMITLEAWLIV